MATQGPNPPGVDPTSDSTSGTEAWSSPENARAEDGAVAEVVMIGDSSQYLLCDHFNFSIPVGGTIEGVLVEAKFAKPGGVSIGHAQLVLSAGPVVSATVRTNLGPFDDTLRFYSFGGSADRWGEALTRTIVNGAGFGVVLQFDDDGTGTQIDVDFVRMTVTYTAAVATIARSNRRRRVTMLR